MKRRNDMMAALLWLAAAGCGSVVGVDSRTVGAACASNADCDQMCLTDARHFPGGMCTVACHSSAECPSGSACLAAGGGVCVLACQADADCAALGRGFVCDHETALPSGEARICRVP